MVYIINLLGSSGDIYMAFIMCKYDKNSKIIDKNYGFDVMQ
ncbi:MAG: hypothetical protein Q8936_24010 [Bacillota bacterium]|nr:hypothetical protein [Bacillota bacterium]